MILKPAPVSTSQFMWHPPTNQYIGEISSTHGFGRVYDDACDEGLTLVSARTGKEVIFVVDRTERDAEGDVLYWILKPAEAGKYTFTIRLFND